MFKCSNRDICDVICVCLSVLSSVYLNSSRCATIGPPLAPSVVPHMLECLNKRAYLDYLSCGVGAQLAQQRKAAGT